MKRLVLFDIDETMISSDGAGRRAFARVLKREYGISEEIGQISMSGKTDPQILKEIFEYVQKGHLHTKETLQEFYQHYLEALKEEVAASTTYIIHAGIPTLLARLALDESAYLGLVTGNIEPGARLKLDRVCLNDYFPIGAYGSDSANRLDLPAIAVERANEHYEQDFNKDEVVIVGDSVNDILCAKHYGAKCIAVNTGKTPRADLEAYKPEYLFADLSQTDDVTAAIYA
ncbi:MAG TPA: HAD family hydrolase [Oculatellaceae cyanobacterium]